MNMQILAFFTDTVEAAEHRNRIKELSCKLSKDMQWVAREYYLRSKPSDNEEIIQMISSS